MLRANAPARRNARASRWPSTTVVRGMRDCVYARAMRTGPWAVAWCLVCLPLTSAACGRQAITLISAAPDGGVAVGPDGLAPACPASLAARLVVVDIPVDKNIAWQKPGYDHFPVDERVMLAVGSDGQGYLAWGEVNTGASGDVASPSPLGVHVTPLDASLVVQPGEVVLPTAQEVAGLVAHDDGFAILIRDSDQGTAIDLGDGATVAFLARYKYGEQDWRYPLTGSLSADLDETKTVYSPFLEGQLMWDESAYGAYFAIRGGSNDSNAGYWRDLLVFRDGFGRPAPLSLSHGCQNNGGIRLIADPNRANPVGVKNLPQMTGLCVQQAAPALKFTGLEADKVVSQQEVAWTGYCGAKLGSLVKIADGYLVFWLSLGPSNGQKGHDIRMARVDGNFNLVSGPSWLVQTPGIEEWNLHVAPYGDDQLLMMYEEIAITRPADESDDAMYLGNFLGTRLRLLAADGTLLTDELVGNLATTANAEPVALPGSGDVAWAFVNPAPDFTQQVAGPNGPGQTVLHVARVRNCR